MTESEGSTGVIDDEGKLFGLINVIDLLALLLVLAVVVAGVALVQSGGDQSTDPEPPETRYATVSYSAPLSSDAALVAQGDSLSLIDGSTVSVVDVYRSFTTGGDTHVVAQVAYNDTLSGDGGRLYGGDETSLSTGSYRTSAHVLTVNQTSTNIPTARMSVVLSANVSEATARALESGQEARIGDETIATIETVTERSRTDDRRQLLVGVELVAWDTRPVPQFNGQALRVDNSVTIVTDRATLRGQVYTVGTTDTSSGT